MSGTPAPSLPPMNYQWPPYDYAPHQRQPYFTPQLPPLASVSQPIPVSTEQGGSAHPSFHSVDDLAVNSFHSHPTTPAFRFSSSSLSAALSDPLPSKPLPPVNPYSPRSSPRQPVIESIPYHRDHVYPGPRGQVFTGTGAAIVESSSQRRSQTGSCVVAGGPLDSLLFSSARTRPIVPTHVLGRRDTTFSQDSREGTRFPGDAISSVPHPLSKLLSIGPLRPIRPLRLGWRLSTCHQCRAPSLQLLQLNFQARILLLLILCHTHPTIVPSQLQALENRLVKGPRSRDLIRRFRPPLSQLCVSFRSI
jgi:hypothetical protein